MILETYKNVVASNKRTWTLGALSSHGLNRQDVAWLVKRKLLEHVARDGTLQVPGQASLKRNLKLAEEDELKVKGAVRRNASGELERVRVIQGDGDDKAEILTPDDKVEKDVESKDFMDDEDLEEIEKLGT